MKAAERAVVVKVLAKAIRKVRDEYGQTVAALKSELSSRLSAVESLFDDVTKQVEGKASREDVKALTDLIAEIPEGRKGKDGKDGTSVYVEDVLPHLQEQLKAAIDALPTPRDGKDGTSVTLDDVKPLIESKVAEWALDFERRAHGVLQNAVDRVPVPKDGKDADPDEVARRIIDKLNLSGVDRDDIRKVCAELVTSAMARVELPKPEKPTDEQVEKAVSGYLTKHPIPAPKDGIDGKDASDEQVRASVAAYLSEHPPADGKDGTSVTVEDLLPHIKAAIDAIPRPKDGKDGTSVTAEDVLPALREDLKKAIDEFPRPKDGTSVTVDDVLPHLEAKFATWLLDFEKRAQETMQRAMDRVPLPKDGKDGRDGIDFDKLDFLLGEDGRTVTLVLANGDARVERSLSFPVPQYREVWKKDYQYEVGDWVTWDGSVWACVKRNKGGRPSQYNRDWKLAIKRGKNARTPPPSTE